MVDAKPKDEILDYCAGSGGKTLAFAYKLKQKGQLFLHDIRKEALFEARLRLKRAGIQCGQILLPDDAKKKKMLHNRMNWVVVDAPCSGTGALRRNPDMKWRMEESFFERYSILQRQVVKEASAFLRPDGKLLYATCSILPEENEEQVAFFCKEYGLKVIGKPFVSLPTVGGMDGFFGVVLAR
jgi:16S rRNA C967 or C1407 C5-methylase (RsmB/RsmF family)